jgi:hypothetical protein
VARQPEVVMTEVGDPFAPRFLTATVVGAGLIAHVALEIDPAHTLVRDRLHIGLRSVGAGIANHEQLEILPSLRQHASDGKRQHAAPVVGGNDDSDPRHWS